MALRELVLVPVILCSACAGSPEPPDDPQTADESGPADPGSDAAKPPEGKGDPATANTGKGDPTVGASSDCQALWAVADDLGCALAKLVCAVLEAIPVGDVQVKCDVAVPLACGIASAAAEAAEALCPR